MATDGTLQRSSSDSSIKEPGKRADRILLSIVMHSNRPEEFTQFLDNLEKMAENQGSFEVVVKIDDHDQAMNRLLAIESARRPFRIKYISTSLPDGFYGLWRSMNEMLVVCDPAAYFLTNMNDEMRIMTRGWDSILRKYVGLYPDNIFRLRTSKNRYRNYYDYWEAGFANDTSAIMTRKWIEIGGNWCPCNGPDSFQECVAFYFGRNRWFWNNREYRNLTVSDIVIDFPGTSVGMTGEALRRRMRGAFRSWMRLVSHGTQEEASRRAEKLYAHVWAQRKGISDFTIADDRKRREIVLRENDHPWRNARFHYGLNYFRITMTNLYRVCRFGTFFYGDGYWRKRRWPAGVVALLCILNERFDRFADIARADPFYADVRWSEHRRIYLSLLSLPRRLLSAIHHPRLATRSLMRRGLTFYNRRRRIS